MKKYFFILFFAALAFSSCQQKPKTVPVAVEAEKAIIDSLFDQFNEAYLAKDVPLLSSFLDEEVLCLGTDPSEIFNKQQLTDAWNQMLADSVFSKLNFISERNIKLAADGNSAIVTEQYIMPLLSPNIAWRNEYHLIKSDGNWKILLLSSAFIPKNEDIQKLNEALAVKN